MTDDEFIKKFWEGLLAENNLKKALSRRKSNFQFESIKPELLERYTSQGWEIDKKYKTTIRVKKLKPTDVSFEDEVWTMVANLGFDQINKDRHFRIPYSDDFTLTQQVDVVGIDKETILIIECKATDEKKKGNFKEAIEAIGGKKEGILKALRKIFPETKHRVKFIFATKNYIITDQDKTRLENFGISHFDEDIVQYYRSLTAHLGKSTRYQLLGLLCEGQTIPELENKIPAIKGEMGGHTYYSFSIEPEKLLKIGYVLHRNKANTKYMPTYQRLIKKSRIKSIEQFLNDGHFFPNSVIININTSGKKLNFDLASPQCENSLSRIGILHLPKTYRSAFIIDGQHRLYGYANTEYKSKNTIPVVAFVDLNRWKQVRLFMQINENQKVVSKSLRNDLNADLLWDSVNPNERIKALRLFIAKALGENFESPLYDRIQLGENPKTVLRCVTTETIRLGLNSTNFFPTYSKNAVVKDGTFFRGNNDNTFEILFPFLVKSFSIIRDKLKTEWDKGEKENGYLAINAGVEGFIRLFSDIIDHLISKGVVNPKQDETDKIIQEMLFYLDPLLENLSKLSDEEKLALKKSYGSGLKSKYWRKLQKIVHDARPDFLPDGLEKYWKDEEKKYNTAAIEMIRDIEMHFNESFKKLLMDHYGSGWFKKGVPSQVQDSAILLASQKNREIENPEDEKTPWDCINIIDYRKIAVYGSNWRDIFEKRYAQPGIKHGNKDDKTSWMSRLERIRNQNFHEYSVKEEEYEFLVEIHTWLIKGKTDFDELTFTEERKEES